MLSPVPNPPQELKASMEADMYLTKRVPMLEQRQRESSSRWKSR